MGGGNLFGIEEDVPLVSLRSPSHPLGRVAVDLVIVFQP
jgi:hypothetical protein